jgi:hypothetical protein
LVQLFLNGYPMTAGWLWRAEEGESKRLGVESPWSQLTSECQRF